jgi:hypothetical protein
MGVVSIAELFPVMGSAVRLDTAAFWIKVEPGAPRMLITTPKVTDPFAGIDPTEKVTGPARPMAGVVLEPGPVAEANDDPTGTAVERVTPVAAFGPALRTEIV